IANALAIQLNKIEAEKIKRVINATGVVIHTNLGRAPLSARAVERILQAAANCNLEYDLSTGKRGRRGAAAEKLVAELCKAEDALIVNNCAAANLLVLSTLAGGREVIVSRGELVEIGGDFRIPDVLAQSGAKLREVGTTNRTKISDFEKAIGAETAAILRVHQSNFRIEGFSSLPSVSETARLAKKYGLPLLWDAGSGALLDLAEYGISDEPRIAEIIEGGADIVTFSGDKLLGGPQAGLIVGKADLIGKIRRNPLYRAVRADKLTYAALEGTLFSYQFETAIEEIPALRAIALEPWEIDSRAESLIKRLKDKSSEFLSHKIEIRTKKGASAIGGGAAPTVRLETTLIAIKTPEINADSLLSELRKHDPPVIARIEDDEVVLDLRTVNKEDDRLVENAVFEIVSKAEVLTRP
ncbi:MAG TPA: L-seryl-tRNA(Sec) selenium transferase, partial [Pyrinomonadaceae bacterium]|nr:L-seryl-tRNA(Sec) selenium transferase [Pyrinomonadaceae bacterium]